MEDDLKEIAERAERVAEDSSLLGISLSAAVLAVLVAVATLLGHRAHTEELLLQTQSSDLWAEYQAKSIRQSTYESLSGVLGVTQTGDTAKTAKLAQDFHDKSVRYEVDKKELKQKANELQLEQRKARHRGNRFDLAEALLEMALVITSITLLTKKRYFWYFGLLMGVAGVVTALSAALIM
ncbi:MAG: hypothetical protein JWO20_2499 [Candidatus Angelobacter sp.]|nr:hypothetical protein [Candidatus Angelobacter sp.]